MSPEQQFKQCVLLGVKRRPAHPDASIVKRLQAFAAGDDQIELPPYWAGEPYTIPPIKAGEEFTFTVVRLDARQLQAELDAGLHKATLWPRFNLQMKCLANEAKPPLRAMTDWHLALALAAGQISGIVTSADGRRLLIKGRTHKSKTTQVMRETAASGDISETRVLTDRFVTVIRAIELTPGPNMGRIVTIA